jgi:5-methylcytosine-specific restriction endonuclease McrBC regulatory subunit McrC
MKFPAGFDLTVMVSEIKRVQRVFLSKYHQNNNLIKFKVLYLYEVFSIEFLRKNKGKLRAQHDTSATSQQVLPPSSTIFISIKLNSQEDIFLTITLLEFLYSVILMVQRVFLSKYHQNNNLIKFKVLYLYEVFSIEFLRKELL